MFCTFILISIPQLVKELHPTEVKGMLSNDTEDHMIAISLNLPYSNFQVLVLLVLA